jgi:hypothetical protein
VDESTGSKYVSGGFGGRMRWVGLVGWTGALVSCGGPSPVGDWAGTFEIESTAGDSYFNEMTVDDDGADITLYSLIPGTDAETGDPIQIIAESVFDATWDTDDDTVIFALVCTWNDCVYTPSMDCLFEDDGTLQCDMTPDYYADDELGLVWEAVE